MRALIPIFLLLVLAACASPYRTVYTSAEGDYYIEERVAQSTYYVPGSIMYANIGFDPWWITANPSLGFIYYEPIYYRYYLSAWHRLIYQPYYGYYRGYYSYWCPPYQNRDVRGPTYTSGPVSDSMPVPYIVSREPVDSRDLWRSSNHRSVNKAIKQNQPYSYKTSEQPRSTTTYMKTSAQPSLSAPGRDLTRTSGFASPAPRSSVVQHGSKMTRSASVRDKQ